MKKTLANERGLSLIEVTIMLLVLMLLTSVLAPSIFDFVNDAQWVKVKEDCEVIVISLARLHRDVGSRLFTQNGGGAVANWPNSKLDILYTEGRIPGITVAGIAGWPAGTTLNWINSTSYPTIADVEANNHFDTCADQLITNFENAVPGTSIYPAAGGPPIGLTFGQGWRGAYLSPPCGPDPWGNMYQVNTAWSTTDFGAAPGTPQQHCLDVFCMSPGKNGVIETPFGYSLVGGFTANSGTHRGGDDWVTVLSPCDP